MVNYKVGLAIDVNNWPDIKEYVDAIEPCDRQIVQETPDNEYKILYWDYVKWDAPEVKPLLEKLETVRHALITIDEEGAIWKDVEVSDADGTDEEFYEILSWDANITLWDGNIPLCSKNCSLINKDRVAYLFREYVFADSEVTETGYIYDALMNAGCDNEEIVELGLGFCIPQEV